MIIGNCPYEDCNALFMEPVPDWDDQELPAMAPHDCEECGEEIWTYYSRWNPHSYTKEGFEEVYEWNKETKTVRKRDG